MLKTGSLFKERVPSYGKYLGGCQQ